MGEVSGAQRDLSARHIIGFACNQAFVFFSLFGFEGANAPLDRFDLLCVLLFMLAGFSVVRLLGRDRIDGLFARPLLYVYAVLAGGGSLAPLFSAAIGGAGADLVMFIVRGLLVGASSAFLLTAWGRAFDEGESRDSVPEVFLGSLVAALVCLLFSFSASSPVVVGAVCLLPLASVANIAVPAKGEDAERSLVPVPAASEGDETTAALSMKILAGTFLFGVAAGLIMLSRSALGGIVLADYRVSFVLYGAFLIGGLTLLLSDGFGRGAALNKSYRLAVFFMMMGVLLVPWSLFAESPLAGEAIVMAGFMGLQAVLVSLFLVLAEISGADCAQSFSAGFQALFAGELVGATAQVILGAALSDGAFSYGGIVLAGAIVLIGYIFLFTERDFDELSQLVTESDTFEEACSRIAEQHGLTNRESEILAYALRGRTSERIATELVISKSTVDTHLRRIYAKCGVHSRQELIDLME